MGKKATPRRKIACSRTWGSGFPPCPDALRVAESGGKYYVRSAYVVGAPLDGTFTFSRRDPNSAIPGCPFRGPFNILASGLQMVSCLLYGIPHLRAQ